MATTIDKNSRIMVKGETYGAVYTLKIDGTTQVLTGGTVTAMVKDHNGNELIAETAVSSSSPSVYADGKANVVFASTATTGISIGEAYLLIKTVISSVTKIYQFKIQIVDGM